MLYINLGGTCNNSNWRDILIPMLNENIRYRDPVLKCGNYKYNELVKKEKETILQQCDYLVYVITPKQRGFSAIASLVDYSNKVPEKVIFCVINEFDNEKFEGHQLESINYVKDIVKDNGVKVFENLNQIATFLNSKC